VTFSLAGERHDPSDEERDSLHEFLMSLTQSPYTVGKEDGESGVWLGRPDVFTLVTYVIDPPNRMVFLADINHI
jgi:hypothetical protein